MAEHTQHPSKLPGWARWLAQDADGRWWCYEVEPLMHERGWYENEVGRKQLIQPEKLAWYGDWKLSLTKLNQ